MVCVVVEGRLAFVGAFTPQPLLPSREKESLQAVLAKFDGDLQVMNSSEQRG